MTKQPRKMTQVGITTQTRQKLRDSRITKHETYDEVITRILDGMNHE